MALSPSVEIPTVSTAMRTAASSAPAVQFDDTCVVIPDPVAQSRMPRLVKKSYSLPLWRRRQNSNPPPADAAEPADSPGVSITVPLPSFSKSRSPTRGEQAHQPLVSCLVNGPTPTPRRHARRPSLPLPPRPDAVTVPLRACCRECYPITEECLREDVAWEEKFTRGARRRRNSSADAHAHAHAARHRKVCDDVPGFESVVFADEVDKRRSLPPQPEPEDDDVEQLAPSFSRRVQCADKPPPPLRTPVIAEEAEEHLFPLPSPSASSPPLHACADGDFFTQSPDASRNARPRADPGDDGEGDAPRESIYYTPDASPAPMPRAPTTPSAQSSREDSADDSDMPLTPPPAHTHAADAEPAKHGIPIPPARPDTLYDDSLVASFAFVDSPPLDLHSHAGASGPTELSASPRRRHFMHMPNLPGPGSFLRAGADLFKGVGGLGGPVPLSV